MPPIDFFEHLHHIRREVAFDGNRSMEFLKSVPVCSEGIDPRECERHQHNNTQLVACGSREDVWRGGALIKKGAEFWAVASQDHNHPSLDLLPDDFIIDFSSPTTF